MTVRIDEATAYEPDALVYCGAKVPRSTVEIPNPVIIVEVLSPSTRSVDLSVKLAAYFRLASVAHYLIVDPSQPTVIHHSRGTGDIILTRVVTDGSIFLDPPGLELVVADIYGGSQLQGSVAPDAGGTHLAKKFVKTSPFCASDAERTRAFA